VPYPNAIAGNWARRRGLVADYITVARRSTSSLWPTTAPFPAVDQS